MKNLALAAVVAVAVSGSVRAAEPPAAPSATPIKHSLKACNRQADARKLSGAARAQYVKSCQAAGKSS